MKTPLTDTLKVIAALTMLLIGCAQHPAAKEVPSPITPGAERFDQWLHLVEGKKVGILTNHTAVMNGVHLVDTLLRLNVNVDRIFVPEHGFRGDADAGEHIKDGVDTSTGRPIVSLYGNSKKPSPKQMEGLDVVIFDIQDVGVRFYTYISSMHYMMEACAELNIPMIVLDRPNPNGDYIDGPVLQPGFTSFVGMHPIPIVHGMTVGELALMINGEGWLNQAVQCQLTVVPVAHYNKQMAYSLPIPPSPNLPNDLSIRLYPSLCFFEATNVSIGRGTYFPFQVIGYPDPKFGTFTFTPVSIPGMAKEPLQQGKLCYGEDLRHLYEEEQRFTLDFYIRFYELSGRDKSFTSRRRWFNLLAGNDKLLKQIEDGHTEAEIRQSWQEELEAYNLKRQPYLIY